MTGDGRRAAMAHGLLRIRKAQELAFVSARFDERGWVMLLHLFIALSRNEIMSTAELVSRAGCPPRAGQAWLNHLIADNRIVARDDGDDMQMTAKAVENIRSFLDAALAIRTEIIDC